MARPVYLFGAGASKASTFQLPTMADVLPSEEAAYSGQPELGCLINTVCPFFLRRTPNLEAVMTHIDVGLNNPALEASDRIFFQQAQRGLEMLLVARLCFDLAQPPCPLHVDVLKRAVEEKATSFSPTSTGKRLRWRRS